MAQKSLYTGKNMSKNESQVNICVSLYVSTVREISKPLFLTNCEKRPINW